MKKAIIAITLLLSGALLLKPVTTTSFAKDTNEESTTVAVETTTNTVESSNENIDKIEPKEEVKEEQVIEKEELKAEEVKVEEMKVEEVTKPSEEEVVAIEDKEETAATEDKEEVVDIVITKSEAEEILNKYISEVEQGDFTYTYQGDENNFDVLKEEGMKGYVFLPNIETDMGYLVDKDNGSIYLFHPSGYFELVK